MTETNLTLFGNNGYSPEFLEKIHEFKKDWHKKYTDISHEKTPEVDGTGKKIINKKGNTGYDYIEESYMRECLDKHFPGWSVEMASPLEFLGAEWVVAQVHLIVIDECLIPFGVTPPVRKYYGVDSVRIQYKKDMQHTHDNIIDVGDNCKQAVTSATKVAINRLTRIGDDVYGKRLEMDGAGSYEEVAQAAIIEGGGHIEFSRWVQGHGWTFSSIYKILGVKGFEEITDFENAMKKIKEEKHIK